MLTSLVLDEISRGDPEAARLRKEKARLLPVASDLPEADALADLLVACKLVPESSAADAMHLALATLHNAQYLVTWNQKHLDNLDLRFRVEDFIRSQGFTPVQVITPERLLAEGTE